MKKLIMMIVAILTFCCNPAMQAQNAVLTLDDVELKAGEVKELEINLTNPIPVTYVGADIILPEGCSFEQYYNEEDEEYYDLELTSRKHSSHSVSTNHIDDAPNHLRFVMFSMKNSNIKGNDGALIKFKIKVGKDMQPGKYEIQIAKQDIVTADSQQANELGYTTKSALTIKPNEFTVTIKDAVNGTVTGAATYPTGSEVTLTATADEGYKFVKWSNEIIDNPYKFNITEDIELSAIFEACKYTITYVVDGETYKTIELSFGAKITPEAAPEKEGYKFSGWSEIPETMPSKDITVTGTFAANVYTITYVVDGETYKTVEVAFGENITPEEAPAKEGYKFSGWSEIPETMPSKDITVTGTFAANVYTITYIVDGETYKTAELSFGAKITPEAAPEKEGYKFSGWNEIPETMPSKDVTVTGSFIANVYTVTYVVDGETYKTAELSFGAKITPEAAPAKEGYKFSGWNEIPETMPSKDITVTGTFAANVYTITYVVDGETYKTAELSFGEKITPEAAPEKEGYKFSGWSEIPETMPSKDITVTGTFAANVYTVTYIVDGETYKTAELSFGAKITPEAAPEKEGYKFSGWSEMPETMPAKDVTVTGTFAANVYTITYVVDGETYKTAELSFGEKITPEAAPAKEGYKFSGWSEMPETMPAKDVTVTGSFIANVYTITYVVDGEAYKTAELSFGEKITPEAAPEKDGYKFSGWSEMPETMPAKDITVTGTFEIIIAINEIISSDKKVDVYNKNGIRIYKQVYVKEVLQRLPKGIYFISGRKIYVQ